MRQHHGIARERALRRPDRSDAVAIRVQPFHGSPVEKRHAEMLLRIGGEPCGEQARVAGLVDRRIDAAGDLLARGRKPRLEFDQPLAVDDLDRQAVLAEKAVVVGSRVETLLRAEEIEDALLALVVADSGIGLDALMQSRECSASLSFTSVLARILAVVHWSRKRKVQT